MNLTSSLTPLSNCKTSAASEVVLSGVNGFILLFQDREIDAFELQQILSTATKKGIHGILCTFTKIIKLWNVPELLYHCPTYHFVLYAPPTFINEVQELLSPA